MTEKTPDVTVQQMPGAAAATIDTSSATAPSDPSQPLVAPAEGSVPPMPEGGQEKYYNAETGAYDWESAFKEQAWVASQKPASDAENAEANPAEGAENTEGDQAAQDMATKAGVDFNEINDYVAANEGKPSEDHLKAFEAAGIPREIVEDYAAMKMDLAFQHIDTVTEFLGGDTGIANLRDYMSKNFTQDEVTAFENQLLEPGTWRATASFLLQSAGLPQGGRGLVKGPNAAASATSGETFGSEAEFNAAMRDPRYKSDPAYRTRVMNALRNSQQNIAVGGGAKHTL